MRGPSGWLGARRARVCTIFPAAIHGHKTAIELAEERGEDGARAPQCRGPRRLRNPTTQHSKFLRANYIPLLNSLCSSPNVDSYRATKWLTLIETARKSRHVDMNISYNSFIMVLLFMSGALCDTEVVNFRVDGDQNRPKYNMYVIIYPIVSANLTTKPSRSTSYLMLGERRRLEITPTGLDHCSEEVCQLWIPLWLNNGQGSYTLKLSWPASVRKIIFSRSSHYLTHLSAPCTFRHRRHSSNINTIFGGSYRIFCALSREDRSTFSRCSKASISTVHWHYSATTCESQRSK